MTQIAAWVSILNVATIRTFINVGFMKLLVSLKVTNDLKSLFVA